MRRQVEAGEDAGRELALEGDIVDGDGAWAFRHEAVAHVDRRHRRLPVMGMDEVRLPAGKHSGRNLRRRPGQGGEAFPVVGMVDAGGIEIGAARPVVKAWGVEDQQVQSPVLDLQDGGFFAQQVIEAMAGHGALHGGKNGRVAGNQGPGSDAQRLEGERQGARHIRQPAGLDQREYLGGDGKNLHGVTGPGGRSSPG